MDRIGSHRARFGHILETFVYSELVKYSLVADEEYTIMYYRDRDQCEVDFVIERSDGTIVRVEVKAAATVRDGDLRGLRRLAAGVGAQFAVGLVLYDGDETLPLGDRLYAAPISSLWD